MQLHGSTRPFLRCVEIVTQYRVTNRPHVNADLVGSAGLKPAGNQSGNRPKPLQDLIVRHRFHPLVWPVSHTMPRRIGVEHNPAVDRPFLPEDGPLNHSQVLSLDIMGLEQALKGFQALGSFGKRNRPRGVAVKPVNDANVRKSFLPDAEISLHPGGQRIRLMRGRGKRENTEWLVDDQNVGVFIDHFERNTHHPPQLRAVRVVDQHVGGRNRAAGFIAPDPIHIHPTC